MKKLRCGTCAEEFVILCKSGRCEKCQYERDYGRLPARPSSKVDDSRVSELFTRTEELLELCSKLAQEMEQLKEMVEQLKNPVKF